MFHETILKIESDNISAHEVMHHVDVLKSNIMLRKEEKYVDPKTEEERHILIETSSQDGEAIDAVFEKFWGNYYLINKC